MAQSVTMSSFDKPTLVPRGSDGFLRHGVVQMMSPPLSRAWVFAYLRGRKHPLPTPLFIGIGIFANKCIWQ